MSRVSSTVEEEGDVVLSCEVELEDSVEDGVAFVVFGFDCAGDGGAGVGPETDEAVVALSADVGGEG